LSSSYENIILVDEADLEQGLGEKLEVHRQGLLHRAFSVVVWNRDGHQLLQKRARSKYHSGGLWTNACCGHPRPGEPVAEAARRRLAEEMGFSCALEALGTHRYRAQMDNGLTEHELVHVFRGLYEGPVAPNPEEAESFQWVPLAEVQRQIAQQPERFSVWFREYVAEGWPMAEVNRG